MSTCATLGAFFCAGGPRISLAQFCTACIWPRIRGLTMQPLPAVHTTWRARRIGAMCSLLPRERWVTCGRVDDATRSAALRHLCMPTPTRHTPHTTSMCCASTGLLTRTAREACFISLSVITNHNGRCQSQRTRTSGRATRNRPSAAAAAAHVQPACIAAQLFRISSSNIIKRRCAI
jgi:hypothetical protein